MTKLVIVSDSHNSPRALKCILKAEPDAAALIFLGDGLKDVDLALTERPQLRTYAVAGNCDFGALEPQDGLAAFEKVIVYYTHGHMYSVKYELDSLTRAAQNRGAEVALFGHSHIPHNELRDGVLLFNPGSCSRNMNGSNTYGVLLLENGRVVEAAHKEVPKA